ncbi:hypothetical protein MAPG_05593 [Magnaporthiopsis poae ATCC 64411]|uniref:Uncharacterized protein n=1 Tax=Magnaporthiopsis poae (strain ATCC 64411 / 73-15) TaxID=644358 RepID=A0A0C4DZT6_MAGP6|nr:hypothetical protein MAPG_05593 [Magnaporthiopsis poae ATCC 64411]
MPTWFLPPDSTFKPEGKLSLGMVIVHPKDPTNVLAVPGSEVPPIPLPEEDRLLERKHVHANEMENSVGFNLLARFAGLCSGSTSLTKRRRNAIQYGEVDHEVRTFKTPFTGDMLRAIVRVPKVRNHIESSLFGTRPVYVVSGLRVTTSSFAVTRVAESDYSADASASAALPVGLVPGEVGWGVSDAASGVRTDSYDTAPGIVFAYQLYAIRPRGYDDECPQAKVFSSRDAFMTGEGDGEDGGEEMELMPVTEEVLEADQDEPAQYQVEAAGDGHFCISFV